MQETWDNLWLRTKEGCDFAILSKSGSSCGAEQSKAGGEVASAPTRRHHFTFFTFSERDFGCAPDSLAQTHPKDGEQTVLDCQLHQVVTTTVSVLLNLSSLGLVFS